MHREAVERAPGGVLYANSCLPKMMMVTNVLLALTCTTLKNINLFVSLVHLFIDFLTYKNSSSLPPNLFSSFDGTHVYRIELSGSNNVVV